jgi:hypothetical protein
MFDSVSPVSAALILLSYPVYVLAWAGILAICGVPRKEIAKWALRQADRQRLSDLISSFRTPRNPGPSGSGTPQIGETDTVRDSTGVDADPGPTDPR